MKRPTAHLRLTSLTILIFILFAVYTRADTGSNCIQTIEERISPDEKIKIEKTDGEVVKGHLLAVSPSQQALTVYLISSGRPVTTTCFAGDVSSVTYHRKGRVRPLYLAAGTLVGFAVGVYIEALITTSPHLRLRPFESGEFWHGDYIGAVSGFVLV